MKSCDFSGVARLNKTKKEANVENIGKAVSFGADLRKPSGSNTQRKQLLLWTGRSADCLCETKVRWSIMEQVCRCRLVALFCNIS